MRRYGKHTDEDDIRTRPNRKGNRPRTNIRPKHEDAADGMVLTVDRGRLTCLVEDRIVLAMKARELGRKAAVVGDTVALVGDLSGNPVIRRSASGTPSQAAALGRRLAEELLAEGADQLMGQVTAP